MPLPLPRKVGRAAKPVACGASTRCSICPRSVFSAFELADESEGERFDRAKVVPGEIRIGDRAYLQPDRIANVLAARADIIVRAKWNRARWVDANRVGIDLIQLLKKRRAARALSIGRFGSRPRIRRRSRCVSLQLGSRSRRGMQRSSG